ncbi:MAG: hypothetical protein EU548_03890 [Promethearchaeota archaeon]|nr:MAG: hypothetical protein EU548_03890 [Candidatus Lokiarchaeota archaeon]
MVLIGQFLDFDKGNSLYYNNLYLEDMKLVLKVPISNELGYSKERDTLKVEKFDLCNRAYILGFD